MSDFIEKYLGKTVEINDSLSNRLLHLSTGMLFVVESIEHFGVVIDPQTFDPIIIYTVLLSQKDYIVNNKLMHTDSNLFRSSDFININVKEKENPFTIINE